MIKEFDVKCPFNLATDTVMPSRIAKSISIEDFVECRKASLNSIEWAFATGDDNVYVIKRDNPRRYDVYNLNICEETAKSIVYDEPFLSGVTLGNLAAEVKKLLNKTDIEVNGVLRVSEDTPLINECEYFGNSGITRVEIPCTCSVKDGAFMGCPNLEEVVFYDVEHEEGSRIYIGKYAFYDCKKLRRIELPDTVEECVYLRKYTVSGPKITIGECAFGSCQNIKDFIVHFDKVDNAFDYELSPFYNSDVSRSTLHLPSEVLADFVGYNNGYNHWNGFGTYTKIKQSVI